MTAEGASSGFASERLADLMEALPVGVFILRADGTALYANDAAATLLGRAIAPDDHAHNLSERYAAYLAGTDEPYPMDRMPIVRALNGERSTVDDMEVDRNGTRVALEVTATPIVDSDGNIQFAVAVFQDITPRREAQRALAELNSSLEEAVQNRTRQLFETILALESEIQARKATTEEVERAKSAAERASRAKTSFLMNLSHELRTPLNHIIGFNELLSERIEDERNRRLAETAHASGRDLLEKINALIELARAETESADQTLHRFDPVRMIPTIVFRFGASAEFDESLPHVVGNLDLIRQALSSLLERVPEEEKPLSIRVALDREKMRLVITIPSPRLVTLVEGLSTLFVGHDEKTATFRQRPIDFPLAVSCATVRTNGGRITARDGAVVASFSVMSGAS